MTLMPITVLVVALALWALLQFKRNLAREAEAEIARQAVAERIGDERAKEGGRKKRLRALDAQVDPILVDLAQANYDFRKMLQQFDRVEPHDRSQLASRWQATHAAVADFWVFRGVFEEYLWDLLDEDSICELHEALATLDELVDGESCLNYADERLGIERHYQYVDGDDYGGCEYERAEGGWEHVEDRWERACLRLPGADRGYIYVLSNVSMPGVVKIGKTHRSPNARSIEISSGTGIPTKFIVAFSVITDRCGEIECAVHAQLSRVRVAPDREFFRISVADAVRCIEEVIESRPPSQHA